MEYSTTAEYNYNLLTSNGGFDLVRQRDVIVTRLKTGPQVVILYSRYVLFFCPQNRGEDLHVKHCSRLTRFGRWMNLPAIRLAPWSYDGPTTPQILNASLRACLAF